MSIQQTTSSSPVVLLSSVALNLSPEAIAELAGMRQDATENLVSEPITLDNNDDAIVIGDEDDWFQPRPAASTSAPRLPSGGKNIQAMLRSMHSPSPTPSNASATQSTAAGDSSDADEDWTKFFEEEQQRRAEEEARRVEWCRRAARRRGAMEAKLNKARELISSLKGEEKSLRNQREALRTQLRALDDREHSLDKRRRSTLLLMKKYESIVAKYKAMNI